MDVAGVLQRRPAVVGGALGHAGPRGAVVGQQQRPPGHHVASQHLGDRRGGERRGVEAALLAAALEHPGPVLGVGFDGHRVGDLIRRRCPRAGHRWSSRRWAWAPGRRLGGRPGRCRPSPRRRPGRRSSPSSRRPPGGATVSAGAGSVLMAVKSLPVTRATWPSPTSSDDLVGGAAGHLAGQALGVLLVAGPVEHGGLRPGDRAGGVARADHVEAGDAQGVGRLGRLARHARAVEHLHVHEVGGHVGDVGRRLRLLLAPEQLEDRLGRPVVHRHGGAVVVGQDRQRVGLELGRVEVAEPVGQVEDVADAHVAVDAHGVDPDADQLAGAHRVVGLVHDLRQRLPHEHLLAGDAAEVAGGVGLPLRSGVMYSRCRDRTNGSASSPLRVWQPRSTW